MFFKRLWFGANLVAISAFIGIYLYFTYPMFLRPFEKSGIIFILLFLIFLEGFVESFISCWKADKAWQCWVSLLILSTAIIVLYCTTNQLIDKIKPLFDNENPISVIISIFVVYAEIIISPMLISKYSSWILLGINLVGSHEFKSKLIIPVVLIIINIAAQIIFNIIDMTEGWLIGYICVFGILSIISLIYTIKSGD